MPFFGLSTVTNKYLKKPKMPLRMSMPLNGFDLLPLTFEHTIQLTSLDLHHRDPFDRIIISQALAENLTLISKDGYFEKYSTLRLLW